MSTPTFEHTSQPHARQTAPDGRMGRTSRRDDWPPIDTAVLQDRMEPAAPFPLDVLAPAWSAWVGDTARAVGAPADYVALALLATAAGMSAPRTRVRVSDVWEEPLALWLALVGPPSSGKTPALGYWRESRERMKLPRRASSGVSPRPATGKASFSGTTIRRRPSPSWRPVAPAARNSRAGHRISCARSSPIACCRCSEGAATG